MSAADPERRPNLRALADRCGILPHYRNILEERILVTSDATREALLCAMGHDASTEEAASHAVRVLEGEESSRILDPVRVVRLDDRRLRSVTVRVADTLRGQRIDWAVELRTEDGECRLREGRSPPARGETIRLGLPAIPGVGCHVVRVRLDSGGAGLEAEQSLVACPRTCPTAGELLGDSRLFGLTANLYTLRSRTNWGFGDLSDLAALVEWCGEIGGSFVGVNPLHSIRNRPPEISPYSPISRLFLNVVYLDVEAIPEFEEARDLRARLAGDPTKGILDDLRRTSLLDYATVLDLKLAALRELHGIFRRRHTGGVTGRGRAFAEFRSRGGRTLEDFATFLALEDRYPRSRLPDGNRQEWPSPLRDPRGAAVTAFREEHRQAIDFQVWIQFELEQQLENVARRAAAAQLPIGLYQDMPIGTRRDGFDPWGFPGLFHAGLSIGAPPDRFNPDGQEWGIAPIDPVRLRTEGYRYWILLLRAALRQTGALRIDHVMGLFRQYWIPPGRPASEGAYVRFPARDLLGILALESRRRKALVIGEDLGTVPRGLRSALARRGILASRVFYFERRRGGAYRPSSAYPEQALATANTHDLATLSGFYSGGDLRARHEIGCISRDERDQALDERQRDRAAMLRRLSREGHAAADSAEFVRAVHGFLARTPSRLVGIALDDLAGEEQAVNLPGIPVEQHPSWSRRMRLSIEELRQAPGVRAALSEMTGRTRHPGR